MQIYELECWKEEKAPCPFKAVRVYAYNSMDALKKAKEKYPGYKHYTTPFLYEGNINDPFCD